MKMIRALLSTIAASSIAACGSLSTQDTLELVVDVAAQRVDRTSNLVIKSAIPLDVARERLSRAQQASAALAEAQTLVETCAGQGGKCDLVKLRGELGAVALDQLEERLMRAGEFDKAEAAGAAAIVLRIVQASQGGQTPENAANLDRLRAVIARFNAAVGRLATALKGTAV